MLWVDLNISEWFKLFQHSLSSFEFNSFIWTIPWAICLGCLPCEQNCTADTNIRPLGCILNSLMLVLLTRQLPIENKVRQENFKTIISGKRFNFLMHNIQKPKKVIRLIFSVLTVFSKDSFYWWELQLRKVNKKVLTHLLKAVES